MALRALVVKTIFVALAVVESRFAQMVEFLAEEPAARPANPALRQGAYLRHRQRRQRRQRHQRRLHHQHLQEMDAKKAIIVLLVDPFAYL
jgi:hypothetical protein